MRTIDVDFEVFKALTMRRSTEDVTENDVLRDLLALPRRSNRSPADAGPAVGDWMAKNVRFPAGTEFRGVYKGRTYLGRVEGGALTLNGNRFDSPSAAAITITGTPTNGWRFWQCRFPGQSQWQPLESLRNRIAHVV